MIQLKSAPQITGHPRDIKQIDSEWRHFTAGPGVRLKPWVVKDMFFALSTRIKPGPVPCGDPLGMQKLWGDE